MENEPEAWDGDEIRSEIREPGVGTISNSGRRRRGLTAAAISTLIVAIAVLLGALGAFASPLDRSSDRHKTSSDSTSLSMAPEASLEADSDAVATTDFNGSSVSTPSTEVPIETTTIAPPADTPETQPQQPPAVTPRPTPTTVRRTTPTTSKPTTTAKPVATTIQPTTTTTTAKPVPTTVKATTTTSRRTTTTRKPTTTTVRRTTTTVH